MKIEIKSRFVLDANINQGNDGLPPMTDIVLKNLTFAYIAGEFEKIYQKMLIQSPEIMIAEVLSIEEIKEKVEDGYDNN